MKPTEIGVEEFNQTIPPYLDNFPTGYVHSVFTNGLNIKMGSRLFFVGTDKNGLLPFGIHLHADEMVNMTSTVKEDALVKWDKDRQTLTFINQQMSILFQEGRSFMSKLEYRSGSQATMITHIDAFVKVLAGNGEPTGLGLDIEQFMLNYLTDEPAGGEVDHRIRDLIQVVKSQDQSYIEKTLRYFLGRGRGLTPSGDDHVVGLLAINAITDGLSNEFVDEVNKLVEHETITTHVGQEYLFYALKDEFSSAVVGIGHELIKQEPEKLETNILNLLPMGHSSGVDTAFGMLMGLLTLRRTNDGR